MVKQFLYFCVGLTVSLNVVAATLQVSNGQLLGAQGVDVAGELYRVVFVTGTCEQLFQGCDEASDFTFSTAEEADQAAAALLAQVLIDTSQGTFDSSPVLTNGCSDNLDCVASVPYAASLSSVSTMIAINRASLVDDAVRRSVLSSSVDVAGFNNLVWALFAPVPLPGALYLFAAALVGLLGWRRSAWFS